MISERNAKMFCKEDISKIENYDKAISDSTQIWHCHHRDEVKVLPSGMTVLCSRQDLIDNEHYYNCPANELIFLTNAEHIRLHRNGLKLSEEWRRKISDSHKGKTNSIFGRAFKEHYGMTESNDRKLYDKEYNFYKYHGHFSWEVK